MIYEIVSIDIHNVAFVAKQYSWWKSYKDVFRYIEDAHIYVYQFVEFHTSHFYRDQILRKDATTMKIRFRDHCLCTVSPIPTR